MRRYIQLFLWQKYINNIISISNFAAFDTNESFTGCHFVPCFLIFQIYSHGPGVSLYLLHEDTGHPQLPKVKSAQKVHTSALVRSSVSDVVLMAPRGKDIGPTSPMGPSPRPNWTPSSLGNPQRSASIHTHTCVQDVESQLWSTSCPRSSKK